LEWEQVGLKGFGFAEIGKVFLENTKWLKDMSGYVWDY